jgi:hypothetical protein
MTVSTLDFIATVEMIQVKFLCKIGYHLCTPDSRAYGDLRNLRAFNTLICKPIPASGDKPLVEKCLFVVLVRYQNFIVT